MIASTEVATLPSELSSLPKPALLALVSPSTPRVINANDLRDKEPVPLEWAWPGFISKRSSSLVVGVAESYKSWVCLYLAMCWAIGRVPFSDEQAAPARVLYVAGETRVSDGVEHRRFRALKAGHGFSDDFSNLNFAEARGFSLKDKTWLPVLMKQYRPAYLFFDSAAALAGLDDENANSAVREFLRTQVDGLLSDYPDLTFIGIHHSGKPALGKEGKVMPTPDERVARGASGWRDGVDQLVHLRAISRENGQVRIRSAKTRDGCRPEPLNVRLEADDPLTTARLVVEAQVADPTPKATIRGLLAAGPRTLEELVQESGLPRTTIQRALAGLGSGVARSGAGDRTDPHRYALPAGASEPAEIGAQIGAHGPKN